MPFIISVIFSTLIGIGSLITGSAKNAVSLPAAVSPPVSCLSQTVARNGIDPGASLVPKILKNIRKPTRTNITRGYEIPLCQNAGSCSGPDQSDYILVATHIKSDRVVYPNNFVKEENISDRQLVKQTDNPQLKNRLYRTFCGDWCSTCDPKDVVCDDSLCLTGTCKTDKPPVTLPFRGNYHCDFIFYLEDRDSRDKPQIDKTGDFAAGGANESLPELPANGSLFSVYFRKGAEIPEPIRCPANQEESAAANPDLGSVGQKSLKLSTFIPGTDWIKKWVQESKPAIYLYPQQTVNVNIKLHPQGYLTVSDPPYDPQSGWQVTAGPDGTISGKDTSVGKSYPYLYYEAQLDKIPTINSGFVVKKQDLTVFLSSKLQESGLTDKETGDFLEYWLPRLKNQKENYFLVYFLSPMQIETLEPISINIPISTSIRIRTYFKPLTAPIDISPQILEKPPARTGNILVEWGGILDTP